ncbi:MAG: CHASE2 domain-containing protein [Phormidium tanganyikae FI6-MK23]|jgi:signal transduction histidine kinase/CHASE2 domain-containing sensor protein|nr:CHASE2 domain-containing protein [Phormidium tanganyikae FI6-MK23]
MNWRFGEVGWRLLPGAIATILMAGLLNVGLIKPLEQVAYTSLFRLRGERQWDDRLVLVTIDDTSLKQIGRFPWKRTEYVNLIDRLTQADASVIAIDILLSEPTPEDTALAKAIDRSNRVILAQGEAEPGVPLLPVPKFQIAAVGSGHIRIQPDEDGVTRSIEPQANRVWAFGVAATMTYSMLREAIAVPDLSQRLWLNWTGRAERIPHYSFASVVRGEVPAAAFRHKIVVIGVTAAAINAAPTPFDRNPPASGVHLQATLIDNVLQRNTLKPISLGEMTLLFFAIGGIGFSVLLSYWRTGIQFAITTFAVAGWVGISVVLLKVNYLPPVVLPIGLMMSSAIATVLIERSRMNIALQRQSNQLRQRYESALVTRPIEDLDQFSPATSMQRLTQLTTLVDRLGRSETTQAAVARSLSIGLIASDLEGRVWFCNPIAASLLNIKVGSLLEPILVPSWIGMNEWQQLLRNPQPITIEKRRQDQWFCFQIEPLETRTDRVLIVIEDITLWKSIALDLGDQITELNQLSDLKDEYLSTVSHELRTPLTNMKIAIQLLKIAKTEIQKEHYLRILDNECNRESDLVNTLLDLQRLESGQQSFDIAPIDLHTWLPALLESFDRRTESRQQTFTLVIDPSLPRLNSDQGALDRIIVELINNACKYTPPNEQIVVSVDWVTPHVELSVKNSGVEIAEEARSQIFERFYRVPKADPWKQGGSGLGLALVQKLVESLQGTIEVTSENRWTIFTVKLPIHST